MLPLTNVNILMNGYWNYKAPFFSDEKARVAGCSEITSASPVSCGTGVVSLEYERSALLGDSSNQLPITCPLGCPIYRHSDPLKAHVPLTVLPMLLPYSIPCYPSEPARAILRA